MIQDWASMARRRMAHQGLIAPLGSSGGFQLAPAVVAVPWLVERYRSAYGPSEPLHLARWLATTESWAREAWARQARATASTKA